MANHRHDVNFMVNSYDILINSGLVTSDFSLVLYQSNLVCIISVQQSKKSPSPEAMGIEKLKFYYSVKLLSSAVEQNKG